jgi:hypothetical protein
MATPISPREKARRIASLTSALGVVREMIKLDRSFEDTLILWAVRLSEYQDRPADLAAIEALTGLSHSTVSQNCKRMRKDGRLVAAKDGKRSVQRLHPDYAESPVVTAFYDALTKLHAQMQKALAAAAKLSDQLPPAVALGLSSLSDQLLQLLL